MDKIGEGSYVICCELEGSWFVGVWVDRVTLADSAWGFEAGVDEGSRALQKRIWTATVCRGYKRAIKQGQIEEKKE